nr:hypothetical protein [Candidatus Njordarchaeum guaymaensis]
MGKDTGLPAVATAGSVVKALRLLKARRISGATPYTNGMNQLEKEFFKSNGLKVTKIKGLVIEDNLEIGMIPSQEITLLAQEVNNKKAEAIFISCTNLPTIRVINYLESTLRKPVISSNTATLWSMLTTINRDYTKVNCGRTIERAT